MYVSKDIANLIVIVVLVASMMMGLYYVNLVKKQSENNEKLVKKLEELTIKYSDSILNQVIENQRIILGNITEHRHEANQTLFHIDDELDQILILSGGNDTTTFHPEFEEQRESGSISSLK